MLRKNTLISILLITITTIAFYAQNHYSNFCVDDWIYAFVCEENGENYFSVVEEGAVRKHVDSIHDAILSQSRDYFKWHWFVFH